MAGSSLPLTSPVERAVKAAVRRKLLVDAAEEAGWTLLFLLSGVALLLLLGSNLFGSHWILILLVAGVGITAWRLRKRRMLPYQVAQLLDRRLRLHDSLSTAYFLRAHSVSSSETAVLYQLQQADRVAETVKPEASFPFSGSRIWLTAAALAVISLGLFGTRYLVTRSLSVAPSLIPWQMPSILEPVAELFESKKGRGDQLPSTAQPKSRATAANGPEAEGDKQMPQGAESRAAGGSPGASATARSEAGDGAKSSAPGEAEGKAGQNDKSQAGTGGQQASSAPKDSAATSKASDSLGKESGKKQAENGGNAPGVMSRMKDAMSSLMAKMQAPTAQQQAKSSGQQGASDEKPGDQAQAQGQQPRSGNQPQQQKPQDGAASASETAESQAQGQATEKQGTSPGKSGNDQSAQKGADAHSGVGQQDGDKALKDAEDLKAMGKLSDIIGKRSAELTGEMTVETSSGKQQLKTNYSGRIGQHSDTGGEINRDEVPLKFQGYVREYMEQVRKGVKGVQ